MATYAPSQSFDGSLVVPASATAPVLTDHPAARASAVSFGTLIGLVLAAVAVLALVTVLF